MSGVYIPMKMPETCEDCNLESFCDLWVEARKMDGSCERSVNTEEYGVLKTRRATRRHPDCPLVHVPPHGRLIDADALRQTMYHEAFETDSPMQKWDSGCWIRYKMFERMEEAAPTIIEEER